ncbi:D-tyrosyl-tRNA(Tyr) deacylase [Thoreauomyces humboldtii]|nr:D-tyrosyl-tRNA(Tyr) deacylase [Thoreauomyces humboldtii]
MRAVLQRVKSASVTVDGEVVGKIGRGLLLLVGISVTDQPADVAWLVKKVVNLKVFQDEDAKFWSKSVKDLDFEILSVSQFTLYAVTVKGTKPDFHLAAKSDTSKAMYLDFLAQLQAAHKPERIQDGVFGAMMDVESINDGPITLILDSKQTRNGDIGS